MESEWELDRIRLYHLRREHPDWALKRLAEVVGRCLSWVKKWLKRFRETKTPSLAMFKSHSHTPHSRPSQITDVVRDAILSLRDTLKEVYGRVVGPKTIAYHLHKDDLLKARGVQLPTSTRTIWRVLKVGGRIPTRVREHYPIERPEPMQHWEMDFGQLGERFEFLSVMDRGTSIMVNTQTCSHYNAESVLLAVVKFLTRNGLPQKLRFDNDPRFVGAYLEEKYPSPLMRFLHCVGVEPELTAPGKPQHKPFAERSIRTLKHECLWIDPPEDWLDASGILDRYRDFYNQDRANQSSACGNRPPFEAFAKLPALPHLPDTVDPDAWLKHYHKQLFRRRIGHNGVIGLGNHSYYIDYKLARERVGAYLNADLRVFQVVHKGQIVREREIKGLVGHQMNFGDYVKHMVLEARTIDGS
jgi:transposase InsO family protein